MNWEPPIVSFEDFNSDIGRGDGPSGWDGANGYGDGSGWGCGDGDDTGNGFGGGDGNGDNDGFGYGCGDGGGGGCNVFVKTLCPWHPTWHDEWTRQVCELWGTIAQHGGFTIDIVVDRAITNEPKSVGQHVVNQRLVSLMPR